MLKATAVLKPTKITTAAISDSLAEEGTYLNFGAGLSKIFGAFYEVNLPLDYLHLLNCVCIYKVKQRYKCYDSGNNVQFAAKRLTGDSWSVVINDFYNRPLPERPYYYIHNVNQNTDLPTNPVSSNTTLSKTVTGTDTKNNYTVSGTNSDPTVNGNLPRKISLTGITNNSVVEKEAGVRYGNPTNVRMEIRYGHDDSIFELVGVFVDYIKAPQTIRLTQE